MGLIFSLIGLPLAPVRGVIRLSEILRDQAEQELYSTESVRAQLEATAEKRASGELTEEEEGETMREVSQRIIPVASRSIPAKSPDQQEE